MATLSSPLPLSPNNAPSPARSDPSLDPSISKQDSLSIDNDYAITPGCQQVHEQVTEEQHVVTHLYDPRSPEIVNYRPLYEALSQHNARITEKFYATALAAFAASRPQEAVIYLTAAVEVSPTLLKYHAARCEIYNKAGKPDVALSLALNVRKTMSDHMDASFLARIAKFQLNLGLFEDALSTFVELLQLDPADTQAKSGLMAIQEILQLQMVAREASLKSDWQTVAMALPRLNQLFPNGCAQWRQWKSDLELALRSPQTATQTLALHPHFERSERHLASEQLDAAKECLKAQLLADPAHVPTRFRWLAIEHLTLGDDLYNKGDHGGAIDRFTKGINLDSQSPLVPNLLVKRALAYYSAGAVRQAFNDCTTAIAKNPKSYRGYHLRGLCFIALEALPNGVDDITTALSIFYQLKPTHERTDWQAVVEDHLEKAREQLQQVYASQIGHAPARLASDDPQISKQPITVSADQEQGDERDCNVDWDQLPNTPFATLDP